MAAKRELPSIDDELIQPRLRPNLANLRPRDEITDDAVESNSRVLGEHWGASTRLSPSPSEERTLLASVRLDLPEYVDRQLKLKIAQEGGTKAHYVLKGLATIGFDVHEKDLCLDRRKRGRK
jgi:hypothetical protein